MPSISRGSGRYQKSTKARQLKWLQLSHQGTTRGIHQARANSPSGLVVPQRDIGCSTVALENDFSHLANPASTPLHPSRNARSGLDLTSTAGRASIWGEFKRVVRTFRVFFRPEERLKKPTYYKQTRYKMTENRPKLKTGGRAAARITEEKNERCWEGNL